MAYQHFEALKDAQIVQLDFKKGGTWMKPELTASSADYKLEEVEVPEGTMLVGLEGIHSSHYFIGLRFIFLRILD